MDDSGVVSVFATPSRLGRAGIGGPAARLGRLLLREFAPARILAGGRDGDGLDDASIRVLPRPRWRRALAGTRLHRLQVRSETDERIAFDRSAARALPACEIAVAELSTGLDTLSRAAERGARTVLLHHNLPFDGFLADLTRERDRWGGPAPFISDRLVARARAECVCADAIVCFSDLVLEELVRGGVPRERLCRARFGVDAARFAPPAEARREFVVAFVGWLSLRKGYPYLVEGFARAALPGARLVLHGGTGVRYHHDLVERLACGTDVEVVRGPVEETLARASVLVLPSVSDGYGLVVLEGMAAGLPVVVTDRSGAAEEVREGVDGFVIPARNSDAIADRLTRLHDDPDLCAAMGRAGRAAAESRSWDRFDGDMSATLEGVREESP